MIIVEPASLGYKTRLAHDYKISSDKRIFYHLSIIIVIDKRFDRLKNVENTPEKYKIKTVCASIEYT